MERAGSSGALGLAEDAEGEMIEVSYTTRLAFNMEAGRRNKIGFLGKNRDTFGFVLDKHAFNF